MTIQSLRRNDREVACGPGVNWWFHRVFAEHPPAGYDGLKCESGGFSEAPLVGQATIDWTDRCRPTKFDTMSLRARRSEAFYATYCLTPPSKGCLAIITFTSPFYPKLTVSKFPPVCFRNIPKR